MTSPGSMPVPATGPTGPQAPGPVGPQAPGPGPQAPGPARPQGPVGPQAPAPVGPQVIRPGGTGQPWSGAHPGLPPAGGRPQPWPVPPPTPPQPSLLARRWPGPSSAARPLVLGAVTAAAVVGASALPVARPGLGWLVAALTGTAALTIAGVNRPVAPPTTAEPGPPTAATRPGTSPATAELGQPTTAGDARPTTLLTATHPGPPTTAARPGTSPTAAQPAPPTAAGTPVEPAAPATSAAPDASAGGAQTAARPDATGAPGRAARAAWAAATLALIAVGSIRSAGWLFAFCLLAAVATATLAVTGGRSPFGMLVAATLPPAATVRAVPWAARGLRRTPTVGPGIGIGIGRILTSVALSVGLLVLFGLLFSSADAVFADLVTGLLPDVSSAGLTGWLVRLLLIGAGLLGGAYLLSRPPDLDGLHPAPARPVHRLEWTLPLALLDALFAAFVLVQLTVLFGGSEHVLRTAELTYAEYARGGFWQLLAVAALTLLVIAVAARRAPRATRADRLLVRVLLGTLTALSLVVVASALYRMQVYTDAYGATRLRLAVATVELWLGLLFVLVGVAVVRLRADWLPRLVLGTAVLALLGLALVNPDRVIAERNVDRYRQTGRLDVGYLAGLSADAVPALDRLPEPLRGCALREIAGELPRDGLWATNLGRERARRLLGTTPPLTDAADCPGLRRR